MNGQPLNIAVDGYHRTADSPVSDMGPDYAGESMEPEETTEGESSLADTAHHDDSVAGTWVKSESYDLLNFLELL